MGASAEHLITLGMPVDLAAVLGETVGTTTLSGSSQATAATLSGSLTVITASGGATGGILPKNLNKGRTRQVVNTSGTSATIYPPVGSSINGLATNTGVTVPANKHAVFTVIDIQNGLPVYSANVSA